MNEKCPFCGSEKLKVDSKTSGRFEYPSKKPDPKVIRYKRHTVSVRCNKCKARGPTTTVLVPCPTGHSWGVDIKAVEAEAYKVWNTRV